MKSCCHVASGRCSTLFSNTCVCTSSAIITVKHHRQTISRHVQGWPGVLRLVVAMLQQSERHLLQCDFGDALNFLHEGVWHTLVRCRLWCLDGLLRMQTPVRFTCRAQDFKRVAIAARHSDVTAEELTQYEFSPAIVHLVVAYTWRACAQVRAGLCDFPDALSSGVGTPACCQSDRDYAVS